MKQRTIGKTLTVAVILLFISLGVLPAVAKVEPKVIQLSDGEIFIYTNSGFTPENGVSGGNGTKDNPYIIENFDISNTGEYAIRVLETTAHFVIRNCTTRGCTYGIDLFKVENFKLKNCRSSDCKNGINLRTVKYGTMEDCYTTSNSWRGIYGGGCLYINLTNCYAGYNEGGGIQIRGSNCFLLECHCRFNNYFHRAWGFGIYLIGSYNSVISCTSEDHCEFEIGLENGEYNVIESVTCKKRNSSKLL